MEKKELYKRQNEYNRKNYDRIIATFPKGTKDRINATGKSLNAFIKEAVLKALEEK